MRAAITALAISHAIGVVGWAIWLVIRTCADPHQCGWAVYAIGPLLFGLFVGWAAIWFRRSGSAAFVVFSEVVILAGSVRVWADDPDDLRSLALVISAFVVLVLIAFTSRPRPVPPSAD